MKNDTVLGRAVDLTLDNNTRRSTVLTANTINIVSSASYMSLRFSV